MKIEVGESLIYSYLRHEKNCLVTQTNWKPSANWGVSEEIQDQAIYEFNKINEHHAFSGIFKSNLSQTIKQAEIDVLGIDASNHVYAYEIAFHENGLQYGGKIETRNRIFKKLLRGYLTLKCYFPNRKYSLAFCSPKVNPATEKHIQDYFEVLVSDFQSENIKFHYLSNEKFYSEIVDVTLSKTIAEADSSELFVRSIKMLNLGSKYNQSEKADVITIKDVTENATITENEKLVIIGGFSLPLVKNENEKTQDYVKKIMGVLLNNKILCEKEIIQLQDKKYCKKNFGLESPLLIKINTSRKDNAGRDRYWKENIGGEFYVCSQWWKEKEKIYSTKISQWLSDIAKSHVIV